MIRLLVTMAFLMLGGCVYQNTLGKVDDAEMSQLGVVIVDYNNEHVKMTINGKNIFDEVVYSQQGGSGISASLVTMTTNNLSIDFCVDGDCLQQDLSRSSDEVYLSIYRKGPLALNPPIIELSKELNGLD